MTKCGNKIGETITTKEGYSITIVEYTNAHNIVVQFNDNVRTKKSTTYTQFKRRNIRYPYHRSVYGVGYRGEGKYSSTNLDGKKTKCYETWCNMFKRCYSENYQSKRPTYKDCTVCEEWHNFQNFAKWFEENYYEINNEQMHLDKDILVKGNKIYSPETCVFVPKTINSLFTKRQNDRGSLPIGVSYDRDSNKYLSHCNNCITRKQIKLGKFLQVDDAFLEYKKYKEDHVKEVANLYVGKIPNELYKAMVNYEVSKND